MRPERESLHKNGESEVFAPWKGARTLPALLPAKAWGRRREGYPNSAPSETSVFLL